MLFCTEFATFLFLWILLTKLDKDRDGIADVKQISPQELAARRARVLLQAIDPGMFYICLASLNAHFVQVVMEMM